MKRENEGEKKRHGAEDGAMSDCCYNRGGRMHLVKILKSVLGRAA
jgi:hypothetical protein